MAKTIALSERVYKRLRELKESLGVGYSDLIEMLIEEYEKKRIEELKRLCRELRLNEEEITKIKEITRELRERRWW